MRKKKPDLRKLRGAETKKLLYEAAKRLFLEKDYDSVMVEDITREVGITKGAFYSHFESKDALIAILIAENVLITDQEYQSFLQQLPHDMPSHKVLLLLADKICDVLSDSVGCQNMRKVYQMLLYSGVDTKSMEGYERMLYRLVRDIMEKGIQQGEFVNHISPEQMARLYVTTYRGLCFEWCIKYPDFNLKEQEKTYFSVLLNGLCK